MFKMFYFLEHSTFPLLIYPDFNMYIFNHTICLPVTLLKGQDIQFFKYFAQILIRISDNKSSLKTDLSCGVIT